MEKQTIDVTVGVNPETVLQLLTSALTDGAADYWLTGVSLHKPATSLQTFTENGTVAWPACAWNPVNGGSIIVTAPHPKTEADTDYLVDGKVVQNGLAVMASKYPHHFVDVLKQDTDDTTGDVFIQCCIYGDIIYG